MSDLKEEQKDRTTFIVMSPRQALACFIIADAQSSTRASLRPSVPKRPKPRADGKVSPSTVLVFLVLRAETIRVGKGVLLQKLKGAHRDNRVRPKTGRC
jgi:hypothetical protein